MTAKSVLVRPLGMRPRTRAFTSPLPSLLRHCWLIQMCSVIFGKTILIFWFSPIQITFSLPLCINSRIVGLENCNRVI